jgi:tetratricopeptide (TPR) repeat protein
MTIGPSGPTTIIPAWGGGGFAPAIVLNPGMLGGPVPAVPVRRAAVVARPAKADPTKAGQLLTIGDRLFRVGNVKRAAERFEQAAKADPDAAAPHVKLSQVALVRGQFTEAARQLRHAVAADPGWLPKAPDIQAMYGEPSDFRRQIARLESRVLAEPGDRDAWFVLGAELYLSGQTRRASDIFVRLTDRRPDPTLSVFLEAASPAAGLDK